MLIYLIHQTVILEVCNITAGFMTHVTCRLTTQKQDQLWNPMLNSRVWATFTFFKILSLILFNNGRLFAVD